MFMKFHSKFQNFQSKKCIWKYRLQYGYHLVSAFMRCWWIHMIYMYLPGHDQGSHSQVNSLRPSDAIWRQWSWTTLAQVMACCLTAPSHYLNQCWLIIRGVLWHTSESSFAGIAQGIDSGYEFEKYILKNIFKSPRGQWVNEISLKIWIWSVGITPQHNTPYLDHDDVIKWIHCPRYWPFVWGIHRGPIMPVTWSFDVFFDLRLNYGWVNNREAGDLRRHRGH